MKTLVMCLVSVLFVTVTFAIRVNLQEDFLVDKSDETWNKEFESVEVQSSENMSTEELGEPTKRLKKSYYSQPPCPSCEYNGNYQYEQRPMGYGNSQYRPIHGGNYFNPPPKPQYHAPAPVYPPQNYNAPSYQQPAYNSYNNNNNNKYPPPVYPSPANYHPQHHQPRYSMPSSKLLIGCNPHVQSITDMGYLPHFANSPPYGPPHMEPQHQNPVSYRFNQHEDSSFSASKNPDSIDPNVMPEKISLLDNSIIKTKPAPATDDSARSQKNETTETANIVEEAKVQQHETLFKMAQYHNQLAKSATTPADEKPKKEPTTGKTK